MGMVSVQVRVPQASVFPGVGAGDTPSLDLNFLGGSLDSRVTFTRASSATFVGSNGLIQSASTNNPRFDFDPVSLAIRGLLVEEARTNLFLRSEEFGTTWSSVRTSITANAAVAPDGATTADTLVENTDTDTHALQQSVSVTSGQSYTFSIYVKPAGRTNFSLRPAVAQFSAITSGAVFNLSTLAVTTLGGCTAATIADAGNGWARLTAAAACTATASANFSAYLISTGTTDNYTGDGTSGVYLWGAQAEAGSFATSYIPTTGGTAGRTADFPKINGFAPANAVALLAEFTAGSFAEYLQVVSIDNGVNNNERFPSLSVNGGTGVGRCDLFYGGVGALNSSPTTANSISTSGVNKLALAVENTTAPTSICLNGGAVVSTNPASGGVITATVLCIGHRAVDTGSSLNGHIRRIRYWPKRLSNAQLQALTA